MLEIKDGTCNPVGHRANDAEPICASEDIQVT